MSFDFFQNASSLRMVCFWAIVILVCAVVASIIAVYNISFKSDMLAEWLSVPVQPDGYFEAEFDRYCVMAARKAKLFGKIDNETVFYKKFRDMIFPMVFAYDMSVDSDDLYFAPMFQDYVISLDYDVAVGQFYGVLKDYVVSRQQSLMPQASYSSEFKQKLSEQIISEVLADWLDSDEAYIPDNHEEEEHAENERLRKQLKHAAYNLAVRDIKLHDNKGLLPVLTGVLRPRFNQYLCGMRIYTPMNILSMHDLGDTEFCVQGCYVILNTYNNKVFVGRADDMLSRVYSFLKDDECNGCSMLKQDISNGDLILVKFVPVAGTGYKTVECLQRDLITAYDCQEDKGYNKRRLDEHAKAS